MNLKPWKNYRLPKRGVVVMNNFDPPRGWLEIQRDDDYPEEMPDDFEAAVAVSPLVLGFNLRLQLFVGFDSELWSSSEYEGGELGIVVPDPRVFRTTEQAMRSVIKHNCAVLNLPIPH
jgi:hypothetical protein